MHLMKIQVNLNYTFTGCNVVYDRIEWKFIYHTLSNVGHPKNLIETIMKCVTTMTLSILINGVPTETITLTKGIRQGDPLSHISSSFVLTFCLI